MITKSELEAAIAECQGKRDPDSKTCIMLAAFYTIKREMYGEEKQADYSYAPAPSRNIIEYDGGSDFARAIDGRAQEDVLPVIDDLMQVLLVTSPRLYNAAMDKLS